MQVSARSSHKSILDCRRLDSHIFLLTFSTYPFWPNIMKSAESWNNEVRIPDDAPENEAIPYWTKHQGGCEGMKRVDDGYISPDTVISPFDAFDKLKEYERSEQSFPQEEAIIRRVKRKWDP